MSKGPMLSDIAVDDFDAVLALNQSALPHVNSLSEQALRQLVEWSCYCRVVRDGGQVAGFLLALPPGLPYESLNYRWFSDRYEDFVYIDRVAIDAACRRRGFGALLYEDLHRHAESRSPRVACEVNLVPRNDPSLAFHRRMGYRPVGSQATEGGTKRVSLLIREGVTGVAGSKGSAYA